MTRGATTRRRCAKYSIHRRGTDHAVTVGATMEEEAESPQVEAPALLIPVRPLIRKVRRQTDKMSLIRETIRRSYDGPSASQGPSQTNSVQRESLKAKFVIIVETLRILMRPAQSAVLRSQCQFTAILDSGSDVNLLSERVCDRLIETGVGIPILPVEGVLLVTAFGRRSERIRRQASVEFSLGQDTFETIF
jgi:hypothetical protein